MMSISPYHTIEALRRSKRGTLPAPSGTIVVEQIVAAAWAAQHQEYLARARRQTEAYEEREVLRAWWQASDKDRPEVVSRHREVFARIHRKRREAVRIEAEDRRFQDRRMRRAGYRVCPGRLPRYVRP
jgi:hypothetical protein